MQWVGWGMWTGTAKSAQTANRPAKLKQDMWGGGGQNDKVIAHIIYLV